MKYDSTFFGDCKEHFSIESVAYQQETLHSDNKLQNDIFHHLAIKNIFDRFKAVCYNANS